MQKENTGADSAAQRGGARHRIAIVGSPNVGKSVIFNRLSGQYAAVSNYPGTTVEVTRGDVTIGPTRWEVVDTPGMYSLFPISEEERVGRRILIEEQPDIVIHVADAKNIERMLPFTLQLLDASLPTILVLNMMDEAEREGVRIDVASLQARLGVPVIPAVATEGRGMDELRSALERVAPPRVGAPLVEYSERIEAALRDVADRLSGLSLPVSARMLGLMLLKEDREIEDRIAALAPAKAQAIRERVARLKGELHEPLEYQLALRENQSAQAIVQDLIGQGESRTGFRETLSRVTMNPLTGLPILALVLYIGLYKFVGQLGAGVVVHFLEEHVFQAHVTPALTHVFERLLPWAPLRELFVGDYGALTMGLRYALALILPIVIFFFFVFAIIEDSGYLPRLAMLIDRVFKLVGLSGRAVIPMVLGLGCDTMATLVTRTLPTRRERLIATFLLALAVPCSAQLGVILALLGNRPRALLVWAMVLVVVFLVVGALTARLLPGVKPSFYMEIPPLRWPQLSNVLAKTYLRVKWYLAEVLPIFLVASVLIWLGQLVGLFDLLVNLLRAPVLAAGLPAECARVFLFGFFRRDYGAAGLYDLNKQGLLNGNQLAVACVALTLFLPCIAQVLVNMKERGWKAALAISAVVLVIAFLSAYVLNFVLFHFGVAL